MTPTPDTPPTPEKTDALDPSATPGPAAAPAAEAPAPAPHPPGPAVSAVAPPPPVGPAPSAPPAPTGRSRAWRPFLAGAAAVLVVVAAFGGGFATGRSTAPDGDRLTVELPAGWGELPGPGGGAAQPSRPGEDGARGGPPDLGRSGRDTDATTGGTGTGDAGASSDGASGDGRSGTTG